VGIGPPARRVNAPGPTLDGAEGPRRASPGGAQPRESARYAAEASRAVAESRTETSLETPGSSIVTP